MHASTVGKRDPTGESAEGPAAQRAHVLVLNWHGWRDTIECLESVLRLDWPDLRVIVCDNGSEDGSEARIAEWAAGRLEAPLPAHASLHEHVRPPVQKPVPLVRYDRAAAERGGDPAAESARIVLIQTGANLGFAGGNNVGLRYLLARGETGFVWLLNNDTVVPPDALAPLVQATEAGGVGMVGSTYLDYREPDRVVEAAGGRISHATGWTRPAMPDDARAIEFVKGASVLLPLDVVRAVGVMDERFFLYSEDVDWSIAVRARGYRLAHAPASRVWHKEGASSGHGSPVHDYHSVRSALALVRKHDPLLLPAAFAYSALRCALPKLARGQWQRLGAVGRAWRDFVRQPTRRGPLRGRYLVRNPAWNAWLHVADSALRASRAPATQPPPPAPRKLLLAIPGHLGDAVIATAVLPVVSRAFPGVELGVLVGSWARAAVEGHPQVQRVHTADHWKLARGDGSMAEKLIAWQRTSERALEEVRAAGYDTAVDLGAYYPNMASLLHRAGIPVRIGWTSGGYSPLYTHALPWIGTHHTADQHLALLRAHWPVAIGAAHASVPLGYSLPPVGDDARAAARALLAVRGIAESGYVVVHMGPGDPRKSWPSAKWRDVIAALIAEGHDVVLTGSGAADATRAGEIVSGVPKATDLVDRLTWAEFRAVLGGARAVLAVDTVAAHLAAGDGVPVVVVRTGMSDERHWRPLGRDVRVLMGQVPCAPCFQSRGCASMACINGVTSDAMLGAAREMLESRTVQPA